MELEFVLRNWRYEKGLQLAHKLKGHNAEMRWLTNLFPLQRCKVSREDAEARLGDWCAAHPDDARALLYLASVQSDDALIEKAASMGDARALACVFDRSSSVEKKFQLARASAEKGDALGTYYLMQCFVGGIGCVKDEGIARELLERAADLGSFSVFCELVENCEMKPEKRAKLLVSFFGLYAFGSADLYSDLKELLQRHETDEALKQVIFDVGGTLKDTIEEGKVLGKDVNSTCLETFLRVVELYDRWCDVAREACVAWILIAKRMGLNKDVRRMIAKLVWEGRKAG